MEHNQGQNKETERAFLVEKLDFQTFYLTHILSFVLFMGVVFVLFLLVYHNTTQDLIRVVDRLEQCEKRRDEVIDSHMKRIETQLHLELYPPTPEKPTN